MLEEAPMDMTNMAMQGVGSKDDEKLYVKFYMKPWYDKKASEEEGRPIYKDREYVMIMQPGNKENIVERPVQQQDMQRFSRQYMAFKQNDNVQEIGTPLSQWPSITRSQAEELKHYNVHTVEQLAGMSDANAQNFMGGQQLIQRAKAFLEASKGNAGIEKLAAQMQALEGEMAGLKEANEELRARNEELESALEEG